MLIFQKCFTGPNRNNYVSLPSASEDSNNSNGTSYMQNPAWAQYAKPNEGNTPAPKPQEPDENALLESAIKKRNSISYYERNSLSPQEQAALDNHTKKLQNDSAAAALNKVKAEAEAELAQNTPTVPTVAEDVPIIKDPDPEMDNTVIDQFQADRKKEAEAAAAERRANTGIVRGEAQKHLDNAREKFAAGKAKAAETWGKWSENYGEGLTGSLGKDAALAAGGLALAGGAYHLLKKRHERKKAEKEALNNKIKK